MLLLLGYPLSRGQLSRIATLNGVEHTHESIITAASAAVRKARVGKFGVCTDGGNFKGWYFLAVESWPLPDIVLAGSRPPVPETDCCKAVKDRLGITSDFACYPGLDCSDEHLPEKTPAAAMQEGTDA
jgi:hypothetical protein